MKSAMRFESSRRVHGVGLTLLLIAWPLSPGYGQPPRSTGLNGDIVIIGANHSFAFLEPGFSPAHIRALLTKIAPAALAVEMEPGWPEADGIPTYPHEKYAALTWAAKAGVPVYPVDWSDSPIATRPRRVLRMSDTISVVDASPGFERFRQGYLPRVQWSAFLAFGEGRNDIETFHRDRLPLKLDSVPTEDAFANQRNDSIAARLRAVQRRHPGKPVALVIGAGHYPGLKQRLSSLVPPHRFFPLQQHEIDRGWQPDDAIIHLGTNLDDWRAMALPQSRDHRRTRDLLHRLGRERPNSNVHLYFLARWRMLFGDVDSARTLLATIVQKGGSTTVPYRADPRWSWPPFRSFEQKARFHLATLDDLRGDHAAASSGYRALLGLSEDQLVVPANHTTFVDLRPFLESFSRTPYKGGFLEAYRAELATPGIR